MVFVALAHANLLRLGHNGFLDKRRMIFHKQLNGKAICQGKSLASIEFSTAFLATWKMIHKQMTTDWFHDPSNKPPEI
jgi:hypothetical protein